MCPEKINTHFRQYLTETLGQSGELRRYNKHDLERIPFHLQDQFDLAVWHYADTQFTIASLEGMTNLTPSQLSRQIQVLGQIMGDRVVVLLKHITAYERKRLIEEKIPFVVPGNQLYLPDLLLDLREHFSVHRKTRDKIRPSAQLILFFHLLRQRLDGNNLTDIAETLGLTPMSVMRAVDELEALGLCTTENTGRQRILQFLLDPETIWNDCRPHIRTPYKQSVYVDRLPDQSACFLAGYSALAEYTTLEPNRIPQFAVDRKTCLQWKKERLLNVLPMKESSAIELQLWQYPPQLLTDNNNVDKLSLFISIHTKGDERIEIARDALDRQINNEWS